MLNPFPHSKIIDETYIYTNESLAIYHFMKNEYKLLLHFYW